MPDNPKDPSASLSDLAAIVAALHAAVHGLLHELATRDDEQAIDRVRRAAEREITAEALPAAQHKRVMRALESVFAGQLRRH